MERDVAFHLQDACEQRDFEFVPFTDQPIVDLFDVSVVPDRRCGGHEEGVARCHAATLDIVRTASLAAVVGKWSEAGQGDGLVATKGAELRYFGTEYGGCDLADAGIERKIRLRRVDSGSLAMTAVIASSRWLISRLIPPIGIVRLNLPGHLYPSPFGDFRA